MSIKRADQRTTVGVVALVLGILGFGWLGIHKFMLGYQKEGIITIVVSVLTCGIGAAVFCLLSIVEGIIYLTKSDDEFYMTYVANQKGWL